MASDFTGLAATMFVYIIFEQSVLVNFAVIRMYSIIPMPLYLVCPLGSVIADCIVYASCPDSIHCFQRSSRLIINWGVKTKGIKGFKNFHKNVQTLSALKYYVRFGGCNVFYLSHQTAAKFFYNLVLYIINVLILVPQSSLDY